MKNRVGHCLDVNFYRSEEHPQIFIGFSVTQDSLWEILECGLLFGLCLAVTCIMISVGFFLKSPLLVGVAIGPLLVSMMFGFKGINTTSRIIEDGFRLIDRTLDSKVREDGDDSLDQVAVGLPEVTP